MPRLLRVHFASIGHRDARLAPLTLDFRDERGRGADTVLWLRNGGGKSSIINLFFSVFRPHRSEFLGAAAEGKARRIEHYVKARDLAFVVTEWDLGDASGEGRRLCVLGRVLAWKGQVQSTDPSRLRKLFFSLLADGEEVSFDRLPIHGLGEPAPTFEVFRDWLRELADTRPAAQVVYDENQRRWGEHLERLGLDPEIFRYQIKMNMREGAADEAFRFGSMIDFVHFLLELAFDTEHADQVAKNLEGLRDQFARRPELELERAFIGEALAALRPMVAAVEARARAREAVDASLRALAALHGGLGARAGELGGRAEAAREAAGAAAKEARLASNERDKRNRWARGLEHLALELGVKEGEAALAELDERRGACERARQLLEAASLRRDLALLEEERDGLRESLRRLLARLEPERQELERAGWALRQAIGAERARIEEAIVDLGGRIDVADRTCRRQEERIEELGAERARLGERIGHARATLRERDAARERLQRQGILEPREPHQAAVARWRALDEASRARERAAEEERREVAARLDELGGRREELRAEIARLEAEGRAAGEELERGLSWRSELAASPRLVEVEAVDEPDVESPGLEERLRAEARSAATAAIAARVDGAEDERALRGLEAGGLLPPTRDVERVTEALRARGINVHAGLEYLAENIPAEERRQLIERDPAGTAGVVVVSSGLPAELDEATGELDLRAPVKVTVAARVGEVEGDGGAHVVSPSPAAYDHGRAEVLREELRARKESRDRRVEELSARRRDFERTADDLKRYLGEFGRGHLDGLRQSRDSAAEQARLHAASLEELRDHERRAKARLDELGEEIREAQASLAHCQRALPALEAFWDSHEARVEKVRADLEEAERRRREVERELEGDARGALETARRRLEELRNQRREREGEARALAEEAAEVAYVAEEHEDAAPLLAPARDRYRRLLADWEKKTSDTELRYRLDAATRHASEVRRELENHARDLEAGEVARLAAEPDLAERREAERQRAEDLQGRHAEARAELKHAERLLSESARRREARDLPAGEPVPATAEAARAAAEEVRVTAQSYADRAREAEELAQREERAAAECEREADRFRALADKLASLVEGAGLSLPEGVSAALPEGDPAVAAALVEERQTAFTGARTKLRDDERGVRQLAEAVRRVAASPAFSELKAQARERMGAETEELAGDCERIATQLAPRLEVIEARLAELDHDRKILVEALQKVGDEAGRLLRRAQRASALPTTLGAWAGKPYLRIHFQFPEADEEQRARLEPLVDRLVKKADIPSGLELVKLAVAELAGERGFDARILKPDAVLRPEPIPITAMNTFSRGQQLTASILLYCTLVQLRARSRGRGAGPVDAGILVLDNPIGTCSSVPLLELQRSIAREMRVQLIYATGVDDLEALETLPSKIRLRNTLRDRASGDFHVSHESAVEAVHVTSVGGG